MQISNAKLSQSLRKFIHARFAGAPYASEEEAAVAITTLLAADACADPADRDATYKRLSDFLDHLRSSLSLARTAPKLDGDMDATIKAIASIDRDRSVASVQRQEREVLEKTEALVHAIAAETKLDRVARDRAILGIAQWDTDRLNEHAKASDEAELPGNQAITREALTAYLRDRFKDPGLQVDAFSASASGGYGKQTYFFETAGKLSGSFVLRRDRVPPILSNDCHLVAFEYPVISAVHATGFPAPEPVWADLDHAMLPGGDFFVMRRAPGNVTGTVFGGTEALSKDKVIAFAEVVGKLHSIDPLVGLGDVNDSIRSELWSLPLTEVVRRYIAGYRDYCMSRRFSSLPAAAAVFNWLLDNVPECEDRPVLVHGDIGLHNILFDGERLSCLLDWEQAHVGDPLEDLGYIRNTANTSLDWPLFVKTYEAASGIKVNPQRLHYQQVWSQMKNAIGSAVAADLFISGELPDFKLAQMGFYLYPTFLGEALNLIAQAPDD